VRAHVGRAVARRELSTAVAARLGHDLCCLEGRLHAAVIILEHFAPTGAVQVLLTRVLDDLADIGTALWTAASPS